MGISLSDLSPKAQEQVAVKLAIQEARRRERRGIKTAEQFAEAGKKACGNKFHAEKTVVDGIEFDSAKEARRYSDLRLMEIAGEICDLSRQVEYELIPKQTRSDGTAERAIKYLADFVYTRCADCETVVEDVKGYKMGAAYSVFVIKRKLMLWRYGITVKEV